MAKLRLLGFAVALLLAAGCLTAASAGSRLGAVSVSAGYAYYSGPFWPGYYPGFYPVPFYDPWFSPFLYGPVYLVPQPDKGQVNLHSAYKDADVYVDNAYAGTTATLKKFWLAPGVYDLEVRPRDHVPQNKRVYVLTGKTLKVSLE